MFPLFANECQNIILNFKCINQLIKFLKVIEKILSEKNNSFGELISEHLSVTNLAFSSMLNDLLNDMLMPSFLIPIFKACVDFKKNSRYVFKDVS